MEELSIEGKFRILALLWHAPHEVISAGGFRRTYEIFERTPDGVEVFALDDGPSFLRGIARPNVRVAEYRIPKAVRGLETNHFWLERVLEWKLATLMMVFGCLRLRLASESFDAVFVPNSEQVPALLAGIVAKCIFQAPLVACNLNIDIFLQALRAPLTRLHNLADEVIAISEHLAGRLESYGLRGPVSLNGVGLDKDLIDAVEPPDGKDYDAVFVGRHDTEKGVFDLVDIWSEVVKTHPSARLVMIGSCNPGNRSKLVSSMERLGIADRIDLAGTVDDTEKYSLMKRSKLCLFPSHVEEWGIVPQEALACGLPVVAYDLPVYEENIKGCEAVFTVPIGDTGEMAHLASDLLEDEAYRDHEKTGPEFVKRFSWDEIASREFKIIKGCGRRGAAERISNEGTIKRIVDSPPMEVKEAFKRAAVAYCNAFRSSQSFTFNDREYRYFYHTYNLAWRNERAVEVPIALEFLLAHRGQSILEVGNVLGHYMEINHQVLDKYEEAEGVINEDVVDFKPDRNYDLIITVSTLEHAGWDETPREPAKVIAAINNLAGLLAPGGELIATAPLGFNPEFDRLLASGELPFSEVYAMKRVGGKNEWEQADLASVLGSEYNGRAFRADAIVVGLIKKGQVTTG